MLKCISETSGKTSGTYRFLINYRQYIRNWDVHPKLGCWPLSNRERRREQIVLCRLRIGHSYLTHRFLLAGEDPPVCIPCQEDLTVAHILIDCAEYAHFWYQYFNVKTLRALFDTVAPELIMKFICRAGLLYLIYIFYFITVSSHHSSYRLLYELFGDIHPKVLFQFLRESGLYSLF